MQIATRILLWMVALIVLLTGGGIMFNGIDGVPGLKDAVASPAIDSELRFLAAFWLAYGAFAVWVSLNLTERQTFLPAVAITLAASAAARVVSYFANGQPNNSTLIAATVVEFIFAALIYLFYRLNIRNSN
ncbi:MAG: DUF4345 domain-containing protein [Chloroflexota bacterium]